MGVLRGRREFEFVAGEGWFEVGVAFVGEVAGDVEAFVECGFDLLEEGGDFVGGLRCEDAGGVEEEIAVMVGGVEAGGFEEDGVGGALDQRVDGGGEGCVADVRRVGHARAMIAEVWG